jgi:DNA-binding NarL/FixJ family response regulator
MRKGQTLPDGDARTVVKRRPENLTRREREILRLIWDGRTNRSIAGHLNISMKTADTHRSNMMKKLRASNTAQLLKAALERKLLHPEDGGRD